MYLLQGRKLQIIFMSKRDDSRINDVYKHLSSITPTQT